MDDHRIPNPNETDHLPFAKTVESKGAILNPFWETYSTRLLRLPTEVLPSIDRFASDTPFRRFTSPGALHELSEFPTFQLLNDVVPHDHHDVTERLEMSDEDYLAWAHAWAYRYVISALPQATGGMEIEIRSQTGEPLMDDELRGPLNLEWRHFAWVPIIECGATWFPAHTGWEPRENRRTWHLLSEPRIYSRFAALGLPSKTYSTEQLYAMFAARYGLLGQLAYIWETDRPNPGRPEPASLWKWHVSRLRFMMRLWEILSSRRSAPDKAEAIRVLVNQTPFTSPLGILNRHAMFRWQASTNISYCPDYCIEHEFRDRTQLSGMRRDGSVEDAGAVVAHGYRIINGAITNTLSREAAPFVDVQSGRTEFVPRTVLGAIYWSFFNSLQVGFILEERPCRGCGKLFTPERRGQEYCKKNGSTTACRVKRIRREGPSKRKD